MGFKGKCINLIVSCDRMDLMGGLEEHVKDNVIFFAKEGFNVFLDCNAMNKHYEGMLRKTKNVTLNIGWNKKTLIEQLGDFKPDIIHAHPFSAISRASKVKEKFNIPMLATIHGDYAWKPGQELIKKIDTFVLVNKKALNFYDKFPNIIIENGIDSKRFNPKNKITHDDVMMTSLGRLADGKEIPIIRLVHNFEKLSKYSKFDKLKFNIVGLAGTAGSEKVIKAFEALPYEIREHITFSNQTTDVPKFINESDLMICHGRVALESLMTGVNVFFAGMGEDNIKGLLTKDNYYDAIMTNNNRLKITDQQFADMIVDLLENNIPQKDLFEIVGIKYSNDIKLGKLFRQYHEWLEKYTDKIN